MSLRYGLLDLLAGEPMSGYDLTRLLQRVAGQRLARPAQPDLSRSWPGWSPTASSSRPARGRAAARSTRPPRPGSSRCGPGSARAGPDYSVRTEPQLRVFCLWALPTDEALAHLAPRPDRVRSAPGRAGASHRQPRTGRPTQLAGPAGLSIEFGRRFYTSQIEWIDWAVEQIAAGTLQPGGPLPPVPDAP